MTTISSSQLTILLADCKSLESLRQLAREYKTQLDAIHDSTICVTCARLIFSSSDAVNDDVDDNDDDYFINDRSEAISIYLIALRNWLNRPFSSYGRNARCCANIMHAGAKLHIDSNYSLYSDLCEVAILMADEFSPQQVSNCIWAVAKVGLSITGVKIVAVLISRCMAKAYEFIPQHVSNCLWAVATIGVSITGEEAVHVLISRCIAKADELKVQGIANCLWAVATIGLHVTGDKIIPVLISRCEETYLELQAQHVSNCLWAFATLNLSKRSVVHKLFVSCLARAADLTPQGAATCLWAVATLGEEFENDKVVPVLFDTCTHHVSNFDTNDLTSTFCAAAKLGVYDPDFVQEITRMCILRVNELLPQQIAKCLWAAASLSEVITGTEENVFPALINAGMNCIHEFNEQDLANCLWSLAVLDKQYRHLSDFSTALALAINASYSSIKRCDHARQILQAFYNGIELKKVAVDYFHAILKGSPVPKSTTESQTTVAQALTRLGYSPREEVSIYEGLVHIDIVVDLPRKMRNKSYDKRLYADLEEEKEEVEGVGSRGVGGDSCAIILHKHDSPSLVRVGDNSYGSIMRLYKANGNGASAMPMSTLTQIAVEFDGPKHFLRRSKGSTSIDQIGPIDARTRLRNSLIRKSRYVRELVVIPFFEWDEVRQHSHDKMQRHAVIRDEASSFTFELDSEMEYLKRKIEEVLL